METENKAFASNKIAVMHVLAGLIQNPLLFTNDKYKFTIEDFPEQFHRILFGAIDTLARNGMEKISYIDIDQLLKNYPVQYKVFCDNNGIMYIQNILKMYDEKKFDYYYSALRKYSLINKLNEDGIDTRDIIDPDIIDPIKTAEMYDKFDNMTVNDVLENVESKFIVLKQEYISNSDIVENHAGDGLKALKERLKQKPDVGLSLFSPKLTTILRGQRRGCLFIESAASGFGKSRRGNGEACHLAVPEYYDIIKRQWVKTGMQQRVLVISTELEEFECQQMWMACVSGVPEDHIKDGRYLPGEEERVDKAIGLIENSNLFFVSITNFDAEDIKNIIKKYHQIEKVDYVYFDYLGESLKITATASRQSGVRNLRTDQILLMFASQLKDLAKTLNIYIWTATQLSGDYKNAKQLDASYLRSAKSISDKCDAGYILMTVNPETDQPIIDTWCTKGFEVEPNFYLSIYKVRAGSYQNIKVWVYFDRSTCQMTDCFVTNNRNEIINVEDTGIEMILDDTKEVNFNNAFIGAVKDTATDDLNEDDLDFDY